MTELDQRQLGRTLWNIADTLRGAMNADDFRDYMLSFLFLRYLSDNYEAAAKKELGADYPKLKEDDKGARRAPLAVWYKENKKDVADFEKQMRRKVHYVIEPQHLWTSIVEMARTQDKDLLDTLQKGFKYIEEQSFQSTFGGLFSEINLGSEKLGRKYDDRNAKLCSIISEIARGMFDAVVANPPFSYRWEPTEALGEDMRFANHGIAPKSAADFAFLLHGLHYLKDDGVMAIILPHGVLFRGGGEERIRTRLLQDGHIDTVIGLPANLFYSTGIPVCILVLKKCKKPDDVLFINASEQFIKGKRQNQLTETHIDRIVETYQKRPKADRALFPTRGDEGDRGQ
jgi:type I restriction-modification system DNA methylase subunit